MHTRPWLAGMLVLPLLAAPAYGQLPATFDWRAQGACTPVKAVQACYASTWAFATCAAMESAIIIKDGATTDLAEQWLISCNLDSWTCQYGTWRHGLDYFQFLRDTCGDTGPVRETDLPFDESGENVPCGCPYPHQTQYLSDNWHYVGDANSVPEPDAIKQAIIQYGPVVAGVYGGVSAYFGYPGGILDTCTNGPPDRAIVLVGWDDNQGSGGVWFLRESWSRYWGENGYMRIAYGCNNVGYAAAYVDYPGVHDLQVTPYNETATGTTMVSLGARGPAGGPFHPQCRTYTLTNTSTTALSWTATSSQDWLDIAPSGGTIPAGGSTTTSICINANANLLPAACYLDTVTFLNTSANKARKRLVALAVDQVDLLTESFQSNDNDLDYLSLTFIPDGSPEFYSLCVEPIAEFPTDPSGGTLLPNYGHNKYNTLDLPVGLAVSLYGVSYTTLHAGTNGYITFTAPDNDPSECLADHFRLPRISALFDGLYVLSPITFRQLTDRIAVTYTNVTQDLYPGSNNDFQIEMFYDGRIRLSYLNVDCPSGIVGLSAGNNLPADFQESDLSIHADLCACDYTVPDTDCDGDVDQTDFGHFQVCLGADVPLTAPCFRVDLNYDRKVDAADLFAFINFMSGPGVPAGPACAD